MTIVEFLVGLLSVLAVIGLIPVAVLLFIVWQEGR